MNINNNCHKTNQQLQLSYTHTSLVDMMSSQILTLLPTLPREYIIVCIGTDRSTGDSLGPLVGTLLSEMKPKHLMVYGSLHNPVHAQNLTTYMNIIKGSHKTPYIIAVDACLGEWNSIGDVITGPGPLFPGQALNKQLQPIGDINIKGVVNKGGYKEWQVLQSTRLSLVIDLAKCIASLLGHLDNHLIHSASTPAMLAEQPRHTDTLKYL